MLVKFKNCPCLKIGRFLRKNGFDVRVIDNYLKTIEFGLDYDVNVIESAYKKYYSKIKLEIIEK